VGDKAKVVVSALGKTMQGSIREIAILANPLTRSYDVKVAVPNAQGELRVGLVAEIYLDASGDGAALVIPPEAVRVDEAGKPSVFVVVQNQTIQRRTVGVVGYVGEQVAIGAGLAEGDEVVTSGTPMLAQGMLVRK
jgi:multidrug efflux pump subunit AcrA (membrane-fusion protein)